MSAATGVPSESRKKLKLVRVVLQKIITCFQKKTSPSTTFRPGCNIDVSCVFNLISLIKSTLPLLSKHQQWNFHRLILESCSTRCRRKVCTSCSAYHLRLEARDTFFLGNPGIQESYKYIWVFPKIGVGPPNHPLKNRVFHYKSSILGV